MCAAKINRNEKPVPPAPTQGSLKEDILHHICYTLGNDPERPSKYKVFMGLAYSVRDRLIERWIKPSAPSTTPWPNGSIFSPWSSCRAAF
jgi:hypothetical protein